MLMKAMRPFRCSRKLGWLWRFSACSPLRLTRKMMAFSLSNSERATFALVFTMSPASRCCWLFGMTRVLSVFSHQPSSSVMRVMRRLRLLIFEGEIFCGLENAMSSA